MEKIMALIPTHAFKVLVGNLDFHNHEAVKRYPNTTSKEVVSGKAR